MACDCSLDGAPSRRSDAQAALGRRCGACGADASKGARFCPACGARVERDETGAPATKTEGGERRQLTVLFCDLVGSTELAGRLDPEDWQDVLRAYQTRAGEVIARHGGHVAQYLGDGLLVYFGWPKAYDDDAERAARAGLGLVDAAATVQADGAPLAVRVGLHTGPVVVSALEREGRSEKLALGDVPNVAARVQGAAAPGTVLVSAATQRLVAGMFVVEDRGPQPLPGVREPLTLYRVVQPSGVRSRLDAAAGRLTRFVGREVELATLVERWERAQDGEGQNVLIVGEAGVGVPASLAGAREHARILLAAGGAPAETEAAFRRALEVARAQEARSFELRAATGLAQLWRDQDKRSEARELLAPAYGWFTEGHDTVDLVAAKALLDSLA